MSSLLTKEQAEDLLELVGVDTSHLHWKGDTVQFCCPIHGESHASCGINLALADDEDSNILYQVFHCFSCGAKGDLIWFLYKSLPQKFRSIAEARYFFCNRYQVDYISGVDLDNFHILRYDTRKKIVGKTVLPYFKLAPFLSGKETYKYFYDRGFDKKDVKEYMIGRDLENETVTMPVFWEDGQLAGVIGRYIDPSRPKNMRFKIYEFKKGSLIFPLDKVLPYNDTLLGVEAQLDCIMLRKWGHLNAVAVMGNQMSKKQAKQIAERCSKFLCIRDMDERGELFVETARKLLKPYGVSVLVPTYTPPQGKDPIEWGEIETLKVINSCSLISVKHIKRL